MLSTILQVLLLVLLAVGIPVLILSLVLAGRPLVEDSVAHWHATIPGLKIPKDRFLEALSLAIRRYKIPGASVSRVQFLETTIASPTREYLRIRQRNLSFYVFAASLGESFFVSSWLVPERSVIARVLLSVPLIGPLFSRLIRLFQAETFFAHDSTLLFLEIVHQSVLNVVDTLTSTENVGPLPEEQRKPIMHELYSRPQSPKLGL